MRSICKKGSATLVAVLALCALAAASASAAELYVGGKALSGTSALSQTPKVEGNITIAIPSAHTKIACSAIELERSSNTSELSSPGSAALWKIAYEKCKFTEGPYGCEFEAQEKIRDSKLEATFAKGTGSEDTMTIKFGTGSGETKFGSFFIGGVNCGGLEGSNTLTFNYRKPSLVLAMPTGQTESGEQALVFPGEKEKIEFFGEPAYVSGTFELKLTSGAKWSFH
jgi:hypothetical protein